MNVAPPGQTRLVIVGATGLVGEYAPRPPRSRSCDGDPAEEARHLAPKLKKVLHQDFADCSALAGHHAAVRLSR